MFLPSSACCIPVFSEFLSYALRNHLRLNIYPNIIHASQRRKGTLLQPSFATKSAFPSCLCSLALIHALVFVPLFGQDITDKLVGPLPSPAVSLNSRCEGVALLVPSIPAADASVAGHLLRPTIASLLRREVLGALDTAIRKALADLFLALHAGPRIRPIRLGLGGGAENLDPRHPA